MIYLPDTKSAIVLTQKTAGSFVRTAVRSYGGNQIHVKHPCDLSAAKERYPGLVNAFTLVRHPIAWYRSYWAEKVVFGYGWGGNYLLGADERCRKDDFNEFVLASCKCYPGYLTELFSRCTGFVNHNSQVCVGKTENVADDLIGFMTQAGEQFDSQAISRMSPVRVQASTPRVRDTCRCSKEAAEAIYESERCIFEKYGYSKAVPPYTVVSPEQQGALKQ